MAGTNVGFLVFTGLLAFLASSSAVSLRWFDGLVALEVSSSRRQLQRAGESGTAYDGGPLLLPLLPYGLSNQIIALKESLALAAVLNWTVVGYGFMPHYSELASAAAGGNSAGIEDPTAEPGGLVPITVIPFDTLIDRASLASLVRIITVQEALALLLAPAGQRRGLEEGPGDATASGGAAGSRWDSRWWWLPRQRPQQHRRLLLTDGGSGSGDGDVHALAQSGGCGGSGGEGAGTSDGGAAGAGGGSHCLPVDRLVLLRDNGMPDTLRKAEEGGQLDASRAHTIRRKFTCDLRGLDWFRKSAARERWRVVALNGYRCVLPQARHGFTSLQLRGGGDSGCWQAYQRVTALMQRSEAVRDAAAAFLDSAAARALAPADAADDGGGGVSGGSSGGVPLVPRVLSLHFRPYPDTCLDYFVNMTTFDLGAAKEVCSQPLLLQQIVPLAQAFLTQWAVEAEADETAAATRGPAVVFVMSHPIVRKTLSREFQRLWATANGSMGDDGASHDSGGRSLRLAPDTGAPPLPRLSFLDLDDVPPALFEAPGSSSSGSSTSSSSSGSGSSSSDSSNRALPVGANSILSVVEQQVCAGADVFIGTAASSISVLVAQERVTPRRVGIAGVAGAGAGEEGEEGGVPREEQEEWLQQVVKEVMGSDGAKDFHVASDGRVTILL